VKPRVHNAPRAASNDADDASWLASTCGLTLDAWQDAVLADWMGRTADGKWSAGTCGLSVARQNGKNAIIEVRELFGMVELGEAFLHSAHEVKTARKAFKRLKWFFGECANDPSAKFPELNALVREVRNTNGQEAIVLTNGGQVEFVARSKGSGRGFTVDVLVLDEAQDLTDDELEAMLPAISAAPLRNPQRIYTGTPPNPEKNQTGEVFKRIRARGEKAKPADRIAWADFGVPDGPLPDVTDRRLWHQTNPALGDRLNVAEVVEELGSMSPEGFARERLAWWGESSDDDTLAAIKLSQWTKGLAPDVAPEEMRTFSVEIDLDHSLAEIGVAGKLPSGKVFVELVEDDEDAAPRRGISWLVPRCVEIDAEFGPGLWAIDGGGPAGTSKIGEKLEEAGLNVVYLGTADVAQACGDMLDAVNEVAVLHGPQDRVDKAIQASRKRTFRDGGFSFGRLKSGVNIVPLLVLTFARWLCLDADYDIEDSIH
jgi:hypothetical protein